MVKIDVWGVSEASGGVLRASWEGFRVSSSDFACFLVSFWEAFGAKGLMFDNMLEVSSKSAN